jgi:hypothetical protein
MVIRNPYHVPHSHYKKDMLLRYLLLGCVCLTILGCLKEKEIDCSLVLCEAGDSINLELISEGENVISNGTYTLENIEVTGAITEELQVKVFSNTQGATTGYLEISSFDWNTGNYDYTILLGNDFEIDISVTFGVTNYPCCGDRLEIRELTSQNVVIEYRPNSGFFTIILN